MSRTFNVAVAGATGAVGQTMLRVLEEREFPVGEIRLLASERSEGKRLVFRGREETVHRLDHDSFDGIDIALFSCGGGRSLTYAPSAARAGAVVVDNSSAWRMDPEVPLVVPEVNPDDVAGYKTKGIIANPNCSTIQMVVVLKPLHDAARIRRVVVATYQAVSGTGQKAIRELEAQVRAWAEGRPMPVEVYPHRIAFNCLPHIDVFEANGYTKEEMKMVNETRKIMGAPDIQVSATTVRVPVFYGHSEAVNVEFERKITAGEAREILSAAPGVRVVDDPAEARYPLAIDAEGQDLTLVGRIREDISQTNGLDLWIVADNIRKGAATNAVQIAEILARDYL
ncbi:aspartate-semialdehyde dehydrogenase [Dissulfurirhabdus thermomarina]|uniref:Aspartate-semialdehyde dehydrogenase n=1 Tax=Dissulfurirhabdus thermomarina TaxID=1765737 RepID=A0A6N9TRZ0_DISTH|nr:aspartate-semialdehyde dehydrogenase [Dissulfurirhabdus thermomarina]NDY41346.1 aspartate-semialdehyde dehydrogenase [Dissulfurirhabdus thermomarina]NMX23271.1 aspartate-semialdehyde dehydrogenase [Dissulfurirhabdus thermomarina]